MWTKSIFKVSGLKKIKKKFVWPYTKKNIAKHQNTINNKVFTQQGNRFENRYAIQRCIYSMYLIILFTTSEKKTLSTKAYIVDTSYTIYWLRYYFSSNKQLANHSSLFQKVHTPWKTLHFHMSHRRVWRLHVE